MNRPGCGRRARQAGFEVKSGRGEISEGSKVDEEESSETDATPKFAAPSMMAAPIICGPTMYRICSMELGERCQNEAW